MKAKLFAAGALLSLVFAGSVHADSPREAPDVPPTWQVPAGYRVSWHVYAVGVQMYKATTSSADPTKLVWTFTGPEAVLFDSDGEVVGSHYAYAGPTRPAWQSASGSIVVGSRTVPPLIVKADAIPWLILDAVQAEGPGILKRTTHIHRVNTDGGLPPATPPTVLGEEVRVTYTAEYFFYRTAQ